MHLTQFVDYRLPGPGFPYAADAEPVVGQALQQRQGHPWWPVSTASLWAGVEALRSGFPFGGFPWGRLAFATDDTPVAALFTYIGSAGVTFVVTRVGTGLAPGRSWRPAYRHRSEPTISDRSADH